MRYLWVRMYPKWARPGASYVVDRLSKREIIDDRYGGAISDVFEEHPAAPGYVNVEWDNAIDPADVEAMEAAIDSAPQAIWIAPYPGYPGGVPTTAGLGCTWLPRLLFERFAGLRTVRYPYTDGQIVTFAERENIPIHRVPDAHVKHLHW